MGTTTGLQDSHTLTVPIPLAQLVQDVLLRWIVKANVPFLIVEDPHFYILIRLLNKEMAEVLVPEGRDTIRRWIREMYDVER
ncbi:hypothetical protein B0H63DRAFT_477233 [Podospora didyma]|uniref:Uncharacterized protein n=1 Tax=Podospora didyma TaxID=330526 RepID=A0AAE0KJL7_9PEZI|nr:hypothetical protein B0H63DRAFT_477233 [Podospora didyma]